MTGDHQVVNRARLGELDALRGLCALCVALFHYTLIYPVRFGPDGGFGFDVLFGHLGPHLFFVISGFAMWFSTEHRRSVAEFAWTRFLRLFPGYWVAVCLTFLVINVVDFPDHQRGWFTFVVNLTMLQEFFGVLTLDAAYWSLTVELIFYSWVAMILLLRLRRWIEVLVLVWLAFRVVAWWLLWTDGYVPWRLMGASLFEYGNLFLGGVLICRVWQRQGGPLTWVALAGCVLVEWLPSVIVSGYSFPIPWWQRPVLVTGFFAAVLALSHTPGRVLAWAPLLFMGRISYAFYLVHSYVGFSIIMGALTVNVPGFVGIGLALLGSGVVAWLITDFVERPLQRYRSLVGSRAAT